VANTWVDAVTTQLTIGTLKFPAEYPFKPPAVTMITPSGSPMAMGTDCRTLSTQYPSVLLILRLSPQGMESIVASLNYPRWPPLLHGLPLKSH
jgi:hypothetical protein